MAICPPSRRFTCGAAERWSAWACVSRIQSQRQLFALHKSDHLVGGLRARASARTVKVEHRVDDGGTPTRAVVDDMGER